MHRVIPQAAFAFFLFNTLTASGQYSSSMLWQLFICKKRARHVDSPVSTISLYPLPVLTHKHIFSRTIDRNEVKSILHINKSERTNLYFINRNDMQVAKERFNQPISQSFSVQRDNKYTFKESYNLLMGRSLYTTHKNKLDEEYNSWSKINWSNKPSNGNYEIRQYNNNYGFKLQNVQSKYPIKKLTNEQFKNSLVNPLYRCIMYNA